MPENTSNHNYNRPDKGTQDWGQLLNSNFAALDAEIEIRDTGGPTENPNDYDPAEGAKYLDTDSGIVYEGDGSAWTPAFVIAAYNNEGNAPLLVGPTGTATFSGESSTTEFTLSGNAVSGQLTEVSAGALGAVIGGGGARNETDDEDLKNTVTSHWGTVGGGYDNRAGDDDSDPKNAFAATVGGGQNNTASGGGATVGGGSDNTASSPFATVGGGSDNTASGNSATVGGGFPNTASGVFATVPGGGYGAAESNRSFVWNDGGGYHDIPNLPEEKSDTQGLSSDKAVNGEPVTGNQTFTVSARRGVRFVTGGNSVTYIDGGSTGWSTASSRAVKTNINPVEPREALDGVESMDIATWEYEGDDGEGAGTTHIGPMAEEFHDAFDVGSSDEHINSINADGVALAAIQGLSTELDETREELADAQDELAEKEERIADLEARLAAVKDQLGDGDSQ